MRKKIIRTIALMLMFMCTLSSFGNKVSAGELNSQCEVKFVIIDSTANGYPGKSFTVKMDDIMGVASDKIKIKKKASWGNKDGNIPSITMLAPTTYNISFEGIKEGYTLRDAVTLSAVETTFAATNNGEILFSWEIVEAEAVPEPEVAAEPAVEEKPEAEVVEEAPVPETATDNVSAEAEAVYNEFLNTVSFIETDSSWAGFLESYSIPINENTYAKMYAACVDGNGKTEDEMIEEYKSFSEFNKFLYYATYLQMAYKINQGHADGVASYEKIETSYNSVFDLITVLERTNNDEVAEAYRKLLHWQADYIAINGSPYNFINNRTYLEEMGAVPNEPIVEATEEKEVDVKEQTKETETTEEVEEEKGIWDDTLNILAGSIITILILAILIIGLGIVIWLKKKNNISEEIHEKK